LVHHHHRRRAGGLIAVVVEARACAAIAKPDPFHSLRSEDYVQLELARFF